MAEPARVTRRHFLASGIVSVGAALVGPALWRRALAAPAQPGAGPYGPLGPPDANGIRLPQGFTSRVVARGGEPVAGTGHVWHTAADGGATFATTDGGWIYVSNSELSGGRGGVGALWFDRFGNLVDAYTILDGTDRNCAGGPTPWGTWLSCEEASRGRVWECDPTGTREAIVRPGMGTFIHEAAAVDPVRRHVYLTEDDPSGRFYRFVPQRYPDLVRGTLEVAEVADLDTVEDGGRSIVRWRRVPDPDATQTETNQQVAASTRFKGGEGCWYDADVVYFTTKHDNRVWAYNAARSEIEILYDDDVASPAVLTGVDNVMVSAKSHDVFVAEDGGDLDIVLITPDRVVSRLLKVTGSAHQGSELAGPALTSRGDRLYFSSQRGFGGGITYEITGPFREAEQGPAEPPSPTVTPRPPQPTPEPPTPPPTPTPKPRPVVVSETPTPSPSGVPVAAPPTPPDATGGAAAAATVALAGAGGGAVLLARAEREKRRREAAQTDEDEP